MRIPKGKAHNGLRYAYQLNKANEYTEVITFLMANAETCALTGHTTFNGFFMNQRLIIYPMKTAPMI
jgi:hypothetical protein